MFDLRKFEGHCVDFMRTCGGDIKKFIKKYNESDNKKKTELWGYFQQSKLSCFFDTNITHFSPLQTTDLLTLICESFDKNRLNQSKLNELIHDKVDSKNLFPKIESESIESKAHKKNFVKKALSEISAVVAFFKPNNTNNQENNNNNNNVDKSNKSSENSRSR